MIVQFRSVTHNGGGERVMEYIAKALNARTYTIAKTSNRFDFIEIGSYKEKNLALVFEYGG